MRRTEMLQEVRKMRFDEELPEAAEVSIKSARHFVEICRSCVRTGRPESCTLRRIRRVFMLNPGIPKYWSVN